MKITGIRRSADRFARRVGRRGTFLSFLALLDFVYGASLCGSLAASTPAYKVASDVMPLEMWAAVWIGVGLVCLVHAPLLRDQLAYAFAIALKICWGGVGLLGWIFGHAPRGYVTAVIWLAFAGVVFLVAGWRENWAHSGGLKR